jgi:hypothetical protein
MTNGYKTKILGGVFAVSLTIGGLGLGLGSATPAAADRGGCPNHAAWGHPGQGSANASHNSAFYKNCGQEHHNKHDNKHYKKDHKGHHGGHDHHHGYK